MQKHYLPTRLSSLFCYPCSLRSLLSAYLRLRHLLLGMQLHVRIDQQSHHFRQYLSSYPANVKKLGIDGNVASQYSVCLQGQDGDIVSKLSGSQNRNYLKNLQYVMENVTSFNGGALSNQINSSYVPLQQSLSNYASANTIDIADPASINELKFISNASNFNC